MVRLPTAAPLAFLGLSLLLPGCPHSADERTGVPQVGTSPAPGAETESAPLSASQEPPSAVTPRPSPGRYEELALEGRAPVLTWLPPGEGSARVLVVAHGAGGRAEDHCDYWRILTQGEVLLVCLRGRPLRKQRPAGGWYFPDHHELGRELDAATSALQQRYSERLKQGWVFAGYSQGATMGAFLMPKRGELFERVLLIEGGAESWTLSGALQFREKGGMRVLFVCGQESCARSGSTTLVHLERAGLSVRLAHARGGGHTYLGSVREQLEGQLDWFWSAADELGAGVAPAAD